MGFQRSYNPLVRWLLRSPLHRAMNGSTLLLSYHGRRSGAARTPPVNYVRDGDTLLVVGAREHAWWRNFRDGAAVTVRVHGHDYRGNATAFEGAAALAEGGLLALLRRMPQYCRHWGIALDAAGNPEEPQALARVAVGNVLVRIGDLVTAEGEAKPWPPPRRAAGSWLSPGSPVWSTGVNESMVPLKLLYTP